MTTPAEKEPYLGDLQKTQTLIDLFHVAPDQRDENWQTKLLENVTDASFAAGDPQVVSGPDGFPYFQLFIPTSGVAFQCFVIQHMIPDFLLANANGIAIHDNAGQVHWIFSLGDVVNYHLHGEFYTESGLPPLPAQETVEKEEEVMIAQPSSTYLPNEIRDALRSYLTWLGVDDVKILLMSRKRHDLIYQELAFNITADRFDSEATYQSVMERLTWFLPRHYFMTAFDETVFPGSFQPL